jgi:hypothetical protein
MLAFEDRPRELQEWGWRVETLASMTAVGTCLADELKWMHTDDETIRRRVGYKSRFGGAKVECYINYFRLALIVLVRAECVNMSVTWKEGGRRHLSECVALALTKKLLGSADPLRREKLRKKETLSKGQTNVRIRS